MDTNLFNARLERFKKAYHVEIPDRIPIEGQFTPTFMLDYCGFSLKTWDPEVVDQAVDRVLGEFDYDYVRSIFYRSPQYFIQLGAKTFVQSEDGTMQHPDVHGLEPEEYPEFIEDPFKTIVEKIVPRLYTELARPSPYNALAVAKAIYTNNMLREKFRAIQDKYQQKYSIPYTGGGMLAAPFDFVADFIRSFSGISIDIRRRPEQVLAACEAVLPLMIKRGLSGPNGITRTISMPLHMAPYLKEADFEKFYWPTFKKLVDVMTENGYYLYIFFEQDWTRFLDYLQELPKGQILAKFEYGDPKLIKEKLGKIVCISGLYPVELLKNGTKEECIKKAQELIDILAPGGGYIFGLDKSLMKKSDVNPENLKAVTQFVIREGKY